MKRKVEIFNEQLKNRFLAMLLLPVGYFLVSNDISPMPGTVLFIIGLINYGYWEGEGMIVQFSLYRKTKEVRGLTYKEQKRYEVSRLISLLLSLVFIFLNIDEGFKIQVILILIPILSFAEMLFIKKNHTINFLDKFELNYKERFLNFFNKTKDINKNPKNAKIYLLATVISNVAGISLVYIVVFSRAKFNIDFVEVLKINIISSSVSFLLILIKEKYNIKHSAKYYISMGRIIISITLLIVLFGKSLIFVYIAFIVYAIAVMFLTIGKKLMIDDLDFTSEEKNDFFGYVRVIQGIFGATMFIISSGFVKFGITHQTILLFGSVGFLISGIITSFGLRQIKRNKKIFIIKRMMF
jgi:hypothetical protein